VDVTFTDYTTTFLNDPTLSLSHFVVLDEIAIDAVDLTYNDDRIQFAAVNKEQHAQFLQTRMFK
jgi:hypothetical protein